MVFEHKTNPQRARAATQLAAKASEYVEAKIGSRGWKAYVLLHGEFMNRVIGDSVGQAIDERADVERGKNAAGD